MSNYKIKSKIQADAGITLPLETTNTVPVIDASGDIKSSSVTSTTLGYLDATSSIQTQLNDKVDIEGAQDAVGTILVDSDTIDLTYNDGTPSITADVKTQLSITSDTSGIKLVNDASTPGNSQYYGTDSGGTKGYFAIPSSAEAGDIPSTAFSGANNVSSAANVTGLAFANGVVQSFEAKVNVLVDATTDTYEVYTLIGIQKASSWDMAVSSVGDNSQVSFSITNAGQVQYTSANYAGFVSLSMKFRATVVGV